MVVVDRQWLWTTVKDAVALFFRPLTWWFR